MVWKIIMKPPYRAPSMADIAAVPWNGYSAISTFSGCGGSSLGYKMAGFRILWANEFVPAAQSVYRANHPGTILDTRDIRVVTADEILAAINMAPGDLDLFDGSPPCASFSTSGKRSKGWGKKNTYSDIAQRTDDLFFEYARLLKGVQPKVFIAENVSGLVKGSAKGYFKEILQALKGCGYIVEARLLDAQWLGVPQQRQRLIFQGVRNDLAARPMFPTPLPYRYSVREAWVDVAVEPYSFLSGDMARIYHLQRPNESRTDAAARYGQRAGGFNKVRLSWDMPSPTITTTDDNLMHPSEPRILTIAEAKRIASFPDDFMLSGSFSQQWERLGRSVPPMMMYHIASIIRDEVLPLCTT